MPLLSVVVPVFNEFKTIELIFSAIELSGLVDYQLVVVDDFSTDGTRDLLEGKLADRIDVLLLHERNQGKGAAIRSGINAATGDFVIIQDADLEYEPSDIIKMLSIVQSGEADVVYGTRFPHGPGLSVTPLWHKLVNRGLTAYSNFYTGLRLTDMETCYKLIPRAILNSIELEEERFGVEPELTAKIAAKGARFVEVPIAYNRRTFDEGKKIGVKDGIRALYVITKYGLRSS